MDYKFKLINCIKIYHVQEYISALCMSYFQIFMIFSNNLQVTNKAGKKKITPLLDLLSKN